MPEMKPVEKFKLTKEQVEFSKAYAARVKATKMVQEKLMQQAAGVQRLQELAGTMQQGLIRMLQNAPKKKVKELEGQE